MRRVMCELRDVARVVEHHIEEAIAHAHAARLEACARLRAEELVERVLLDEPQLLRCHAERYVR